jgi:hypothetical protein
MKFLASIVAWFRKIFEKPVKGAPVVSKAPEATPVATVPVESIVVPPSPPSEPVSTLPPPTPVDSSVPHIPAVIFYKPQLDAWVEQHRDLMLADRDEYFRQYRAYMDSLAPPPGSAGGLGEIPPINLNKN